MFSICSVFIEICRAPQCSFNTMLSEERTNRFGFAMKEILLTRNMSFPCQIIINYSAQLFILFDGSLQGYSACVYACSNGQFKLISSSAKILGKSALSEWSRRYARNCSTYPSPPLDSEIILNMSTKNDPAGPPAPVFHGTRFMEISTVYCCIYAYMHYCYCSDSALFAWTRL